MRVLASAMVLLAACCLGFAQNDIPPKLLELVSGPDRAEIPCKIRVSKPELTFQQEYAVIVHGQFSHKLVERGDIRHLQMLVKVKDAQGRWLIGEDYDDFKVPERLHGHDVAYSALVYLRPGRYQLAVAIFDTESGKTNVYHVDVTVEGLSNDPLPVLDELLPEAQFPTQIDDRREFWEIGNHLPAMRLQNAKPTRLDIVLNITKRFRWDALYRMDVQNMLESGSALARFRPANGCVRLSVIDVLRTKVILDRFPIDQLNWSKLQESIAKIDQNVVDVHVLSNQKKVAQFTDNYLQGLAAEKGGCKAASEVTPMVIVVSPDVVLPYGNKLGELEQLPHNVFVYVHVGGGSSWVDGIGQILNSAKPQKFNCENAREFRAALAKIAGLISGSDLKHPALIQH